MKQRIHELGNSNESYRQNIQALEGQVRNKQEEMQRLQTSWNELNDTNEQLKTAHDEILLELTKWKRDTTAVYSSVVSHQPVELEREYSYLMDQSVANYI